MKAGYIAEIDMRSGEFNDIKASLEALYMIDKSDEDLQKDEESKDKIVSALAAADQLVPSYQTTIKSVRLAIDSCIMFESVLIYIYIYIYTITKPQDIYIYILYYIGCPLCFKYPWKKKHQKTLFH